VVSDTTGETHMYKHKKSNIKKAGDNDMDNITTTQILEDLKGTGRCIYAN